MMKEQPVFRFAEEDDVGKILVFHPGAGRV